MDRDELDLYGVDEIDSICNVFVSSDDSDLLCDLCSEDGNHFEAEGYCVDCTHHLCSVCLVYHRKPKPMRHHQLLDKRQMPKAKTDKVYKDECTDTCRTHKDKILEFYCQDHKQFGCAVCATIEHRACNVGYIPTLAEPFIQSHEYKTFRNALDSLSKKARFVQDASTRNIEAVRKHANKALDEIRNLREEIDKYLDKLEKNISERVLEIQKEYQNKIESILVDSYTLAGNLKEMQDDLNDREIKKQNCQLFVDVKKGQETLPSQLEDIKRMEQKNYVREIEFIPSTSALSFIRDQTLKLGSLVSFDKSLPVQADTDKSDSLITSFAVLSDDRIAVTDSNNNSVKIIDTKHEKVILSKFLPGYTYGITTISDNEIAVSQNANIETYSVSEQIEPKDTIVNARLGWTIAYTNTGFIGCTSSSPYRVRTVNKKGEVLKTFPTDAKRDVAENHFENPWHIVISQDHTMLYVSDWGKETLTCMTFDGEVRAQYKPKSKWRPNGVAVSRDGTVFVCDYIYSNIHIFTRDLQVLGVIIGDRYGIRNPRGLAYCNKGRKLYVGMGSGDPVVVLNV